MIYKRDAWTKAIGPFSGHPQTQEVPALLDIVHTAPTRSDARRQALDKLAAICNAFLKADPKGVHPQFGPVYVLAAGVGKLLRSLDRLAAHVDANKATFNLHKTGGAAITDTALRDRLHGHGLAATTIATTNRMVQDATVGRSLVNAYYAHHGQVSLRHNYWLEAADPLHRYWGGAPASADDLFKFWRDNDNSGLDFFSWIDLNKDKLVALPQFADLEYLFYADRGVRYMSSEERYRYRVKFNPDTRLAERRDPKAQVLRSAKRFELFSTRGLETAFSGKHMAIWVCSNAAYSRSGKHKFYSHSHKVGRLHHSSFQEGRDVCGAGEWAISAGQILLITHKTGHYQAGWEELLAVLKLLDPVHDLADTLCCWIDYASGETTNYYWAWEAVHHPAKMAVVQVFAKGALDTVKAENLKMVEDGVTAKGRRVKWYSDRGYTRPELDATGTGGSTSSSSTTSSGSGTAGRKRAFAQGSATLARPKDVPIGQRGVLGALPQGPKTRVRRI